MNTRLMVTAVSVALGLAGSVFATHANACSFGAGTAPGSAAAQAAAQFAAGTHSALSNSGNAHGSIVGMWRFAFTADDGMTSLDWGFQQWHSDGTELTNSGGHPAVGGNFCMGVWAQQGAGAYTLNHWAIAWALPPDFNLGELGGLVHVQETVTVDASGNSMSGNVTQTLYEMDGVTIAANPVTTVVGLGNFGVGTVSATRITP